jgi:uncharacterized protein
MLIQRGAEVFAIDARPSDSIAIALRLQARVFTTDDLLSSSAVQVESSEPGEQDAPSIETSDPTLNAEQLKEYLKKLNPEDLGRFNP